MPKQVYIRRLPCGCTALAGKENDHLTWNDIYAVCGIQCYSRDSNEVKEWLRNGSTRKRLPKSSSRARLLKKYEFVLLE